MTFRLLVEPDADTGRWSAVFPELPGCATAGDTEAEAITNAREALALWFEPVTLELEPKARLPAGHRGHARQQTDSRRDDEEHPPRQRAVRG
ncbi:MAG TPA: type II toxin-antitoxin system HicB family antitoxin [Verrucomicrobiota bacterium]|nr:type II toxin-antitoxin system HicB family antitoxin [Verrucomicrobiota bacterium]